MTTFKQVPLTCGGHTRPVVHLDFSDVTKDGYYLISACKGEFWRLICNQCALLPWPIFGWKSCKCVGVCFNMTDVDDEMCSKGLHFSCLCGVVRPTGVHSMHVVTFSFRTCRKYLEYPLVYFLGCSPWWLRSCFLFTYRQHDLQVPRLCIHMNCWRH